MGTHLSSSNQLHSAKLLQSTALLGILAAVFFLIPQNSQAGSFKANVKVLEYYGYVGRAASGHHLYGVKILHEGRPYRVELERPMPCLGEHVGNVETVTVKRRGDQWESVSFDGHFAEIHRVVKLQPDCAHDHSDPLTDLWSKIWSPITSLFE